MLFLNIGHVSSQVTSEFPIGLKLVYEKETEYWMSTTHTWIDTYDVVGWNSTDNSRVIIENGYLRNDPWQNNTFEVSLPSWDYEFFSDEYNETVQGWLYPLWIDTSSWVEGENVTIPEGSENSHSYLVGRFIYEFEDGRIPSWRARTEYIGVNDWEYTVTLVYETHFGVLIKTSSVRMPDIDDMANYATHESTLSWSNIMDELVDPTPLQVLFSIEGSLIIGICIEVFVIAYFVVIKPSKTTSED